MSDVKQDIYQEITDKIIAQIEAGTPPWRKPWKSGFPINASTQKEYSGINIMLLQMADCEDNRFMTFKQAAAMGYSIKKNEKAAAHIVKYIEVTANEARRSGDTEAAAETENNKRLILKSYAVFNVSQLDPPFPPHTTIHRNVTPIAAATAIIDGLKSTGLKVVEGAGIEACYVPSTDTIKMPLILQFFGKDEAEIAAAHAATLLHEGVHATLPAKRCGRLMRDSEAITKTERALEELTAEIGAGDLCGKCGIVATPDNVGQNIAYLASWAAVLKSDKKAIFKAVSAARKACEWLETHALAPFHELQTDRKQQAPITAPSIPQIQVAIESPQIESGITILSPHEIPVKTKAKRAARM